MAITLSTMRERVRARADMKNSTFVEDSELNQYINSSYQELYDILVQSFEDYYTLPPVSFTIATSSDYYTLPTDFYKLRGVDSSLDSSNWFTLTPFDFANRNTNNNNLAYALSGIYDRNYRIVGNRLYITPTDSAPGNYRIWYVPVATVLTTDSSTLDGINGWEEYIVVDAARKCLAKEESDTSFMVQEKEALRQRIISASLRRDAGMPKKITDMNALDFYYNGRRVF
jgi:hypothetical protein